MIKYFFLVLFLISSSGVNAATIYVSNAATNGYAVGVDGGACTTKGAPCLTLGGGQTAASGGDTIVLNDGTYTQANGITITKELTINAENAGQAVLVTTNAPQTTLQFSANLTLGAIEINGANATASNVKPTAITLTLNLNNTRLTNCPSYCIDNTLGRIVTSTATDVIMTSIGTNSPGIWKNTMGATSSFTISNGQFSADSLANQAKALSFLYASAGTGTISITNSRISAKANSGANNVGCVYSTGVASLTLQNNRCYSSGSTTSPEGFVHGDSVTSVATTFIDISNNTITTNIDTASRTGGHGIQVGDETELGNAAISGVKIYQNTIEGFDHGITCSYETTGCNIYRNKISNSDIGIISEGGTLTKIFSNLIIDGQLTGACLRARNGSSATFYNNTCVTNAETNTTLKWIEVDDSNSGSVFQNNGFINKSGTVPALTVDIGSGLSATFVNNGYFSPNYATNAFNNGTTNYSTVATWIAANDTNGVATSPNLIAPFRTDNEFSYRLPSSSSWKRTGKDLNIGNYSDCAGRAFSHPPSIGAYESASGDEASTRTNR